MERFGFGKAIKNLKDGQCVAREGWNGKNMYIFLGLPRVEIDRHVEGGFVTGVDAADYYGVNYSETGVICMKTAQDTIVVGWLASQTDMLARDWYVEKET